MNSDNWNIIKGTKIICPNCLTPQGTFTHNVSSYQRLDDHSIEFLIGRVRVEDPEDLGKYKTLTISKCCLVPWCKQGNFFIENVGWYPYSPYPKEINVKN